MSRSLCFHVRTYKRCDWIKIFSPNRGSSKKSVSLGACLIQQEELPLPIVQSFHANFSNPLSVESWQAGCKPPKWSRAINCTLACQRETRGASEIVLQHNISLWQVIFLIQA